MTCVIVPVCRGLIKNGERQDEESFGGRRRTEALRQLCKMNPSQALRVRGMVVCLVFTSYGEGGQHWSGWTCIGRATASLHVAAIMTLMAICYPFAPHCIEFLPPYLWTQHVSSSCLQLFSAPTDFSLCLHLLFP